MDIFQWLKNSKYSYTWNVKIGNRIPDIIAFNNNEIIAFEIKRYSTEVTTAIGQCLHYLKKTNMAYIILPSKAAKSLPKYSLQILKKNGIGLIQANDKIKILLDGKKFGVLNEKFLEQLKKRSLTKSFNGKNVEAEIIELLSKHPEGLTSMDISKQLGMHRHTITKYLYQLVGSEEIHQRQVGPAKLCYLSKKGEKR